VYQSLSMYLLSMYPSLSIYLFVSVYQSICSSVSATAFSCNMYVSSKLYITSVLENLLILNPHLVGHFISPPLNIFFLCSLWWTLGQFPFSIFLKLWIQFIKIILWNVQLSNTTVNLLRIVFADYIVKSRKCCRKMGLYFWCETRVVLQYCKPILQDPKYPFNNIPS